GTGRSPALRDSRLRPCLGPAPSPRPGSCPKPAPIPVLCPGPVPIPGPCTVPSPVHIPVPNSGPCPSPAPIPSPIPVPVPIPAPVPFPFQIPVSVLLPFPFPFPFQAPVTVPVPLTFPFLSQPRSRSYSRPSPVPIPIPSPVLVPFLFPFLSRSRSRSLTPSPSRPAASQRRHLGARACGKAEDPPLPVRPVSIATARPGRLRAPQSEGTEPQNRGTAPAPRGRCPPPPSAWIGRTFPASGNSGGWRRFTASTCSRFLCLAGNRIQRVENLQALPHLSALDLSHNQIRALDAEELPRSLRILDLTGNECSRQDGYRDLVVAALPHLLQLDSQPIHGDTAREEAGGGSCSSSSEEEEEEEEDEELFPELRIPFTVDKDFLQDVHRELAGRARWRRRKSLEEHRARLEELRELRALLLDPGQGQLCPQGAQLSPLPASRVSQRAPGAIQPPGKALEKEPGAKGAGNGQLSQIPCSSSKE
uniref:Leucine rich repeat containing 46 n=1 Tax=Cyanistes caeruleus TaxID=156563 RepID=A0A8C0VPU5_CYACU